MNENYSEPIRPGYYAVIPAKVRYSKEVSDGAKLMYGEITALSNDRGYCWATNTYFAELYGCSDRTARRWISELAAAGFILTLVDSAAGNSRKIWLTESQDVYGQKRPEGMDKNVRTYGQKRPEGMDKNVHHNNIVNSIENRESEKTENSPAPPVENLHTSQPNKPDLTMPEGGADGGLTYSDRPRPKDANDLKEKLRNYFVANPTQWADYVLENGKARNWPEEKIADTVTAYCLNKQKNSDFQRTYHEYTADLTTWFLRQPSFDTKKPAETGAATKLTPSPYKRLTA